jgi:hypothetical protein
MNINDVLTDVTLPEEKAPKANKSKKIKESAVAPVKTNVQEAKEHIYGLGHDYEPWTLEMIKRTQPDVYERMRNLD